MANVKRRAGWRSGPANGWHEDLIWYAAAIHQMKLLTPGWTDALSLFQTFFGQGGLSDAQGQTLSSIVHQWSDPASLGYQSQVHSTFLRRQEWPSHQGRRAIWHQCAHNSWFFLPWHRAYLLEFESIARGHIEGLGGPADSWGLPYWNYSDYRTASRASSLPLPMRDEVLPDGVTVPGVVEVDGSFPNPLFDPTRAMTSTSASPAAGWADASEALLRPHFANQQDTGRVSFGGGVLEDLSQFHNAEEIGKVDLQPHGSVHGEVGGNMSQFFSAGLDPVFWMHHCNVDRLWETYAVDLEHGYPFETANEATPSPAKQSWDTQEFKFLRPDGAVVTWTSPQVLHLEQLDYEYDTTEPPQFIPTPAPPPEAEIDPFGRAAEAIPEPVAVVRDVALAGATEATLSGGDGAGAAADGRWTLRFDGIRAERPAPTSYQVFVGLSPDERADPTDLARYVGLMSLFGVFEASLDNGSSPGNGRVRVFDVTSQLAALGPEFNPLRTTVRLVPLNPERDLRGAGMFIERITLQVG